jgi:DNA-binding response OmpR family regulator
LSHVRSIEVTTAGRRTAEDDGPITVGPISLDRRTYAVRVGRRAVSLSPTAFDLLAFLLEHRDRVVGHAEIAEHVLRTVAGDTRLLVRVHVHNLRHAFGGSLGARLIQTTRGRGYRLVV